MKRFLKPNNKHGCLTWIAGFALLITAWWNQPYFGWTYCGANNGWKHETDFVEAFRPYFHNNYKNRNIESILKTQEWRNGKPLSLWFPKEELENHIHETTNLALDQMKECVAVRGLVGCQYVGPDENAHVRTYHGDLVPKSEQASYRFIVPNTDVGMWFHPPNNGAPGFRIKNYKSGFVRYGSTCTLGCNCKGSWDG